LSGPKNARLDQSTRLGLTRSSICALAGGKTQRAGIGSGALTSILLIDLVY